VKSSAIRTHVAPWRWPAVCLACLAVLWRLAPVALAADKDKKEEKKPEPPRVIVALPLASVIGKTNLVRLRGNSLSDVTEVRWTNETPATISFRAASKLDVPRDADARVVGDSQVEVALFVPPEMPSGTNYFIVRSTNGTSAPHALRWVPPGALTDEKEPNGGYEKAQLIASGMTVHGSIREDADVDVFRFEGKAGQWVVAEVQAMRLGAPLDPVLTLHGAGGYVLAQSDDSAGHRDATLRFRLPTDRARYYLSLVDSLNRGGPAYEYLLSVRLE